VNCGKQKYQIALVVIGVLVVLVGVNGAVYEYCALLVSVLPIVWLISKIL